MTIVFSLVSRFAGNQNIYLEALILPSSNLFYSSSSFLFVIFFFSLISSFFLCCCWCWSSSPPPPLPSSSSSSHSIFLLPTPCSSISDQTLVHCIGLAHNDSILQCNFVITCSKGKQKQNQIWFEGRTNVLTRHICHRACHNPCSHDYDVHIFSPPKTRSKLKRRVTSTPEDPR